MTDRLANVQRRKVWPVFVDRWEPALVSIHATKGGAEAKLEHLAGAWCGDENCFHVEIKDAFIGEPMEILP
jgi:hypothetical protein